MSQEAEPSHICPLCGKPNDCTMAKGNRDNPRCWCRDVIIDPEALARAQAIAGTHACICRKCATALDSGQTIVRLYGTAACHLCEEAEHIALEAGAFPIHIDIAKDDGLSEKYGVLIPVLQRIDDGAELVWPFDAAAVAGFLA